MPEFNPLPYEVDEYGVVLDNVEPVMPFKVVESVIVDDPNVSGLSGIWGKEEEPVVTPPAAAVDAEVVAVESTWGIEEEILVDIGELESVIEAEEVPEETSHGFGLGCAIFYLNLNIDRQ